MQYIQRINSSLKIPNSYNVVFFPHRITKYNFLMQYNNRYFIILWYRHIYSLFILYKKCSLVLDKSGWNEREWTLTLVLKTIRLEVNNDCLQDFIDVLKADKEKLILIIGRNSRKVLKSYLLFWCFRLMLLKMCQYSKTPDKRNNYDFRF